MTLELIIFITLIEESKDTSDNIIRCLAIIIYYLPLIIPVIDHRLVGQLPLLKSEMIDTIINPLKTTYT